MTVCFSSGLTSSLTVTTSGSSLRLAITLMIDDRGEHGHNDHANNNLLFSTHCHSLGSLFRRGFNVTK